MDEVSAQIREINPGADILFAQRCDVDTGYLLDQRPGGVVESARSSTGSSSEPQTDDAHDHHGHDHDDHAHANLPAESFVLDAGGNPDIAKVRQFFEAMPASVWRAKGFMAMDGKPCLIQFTMGQLEISPVSTPANEKIVFIGRNMDRPDIESRFAFAKRRESVA
jgi:G3E family GTPase